MLLSLILLNAFKDIGLAVNTMKTKYVAVVPFVSLHSRIQRKIAVTVFSPSHLSDDTTK